MENCQEIQELQAKVLKWLSRKIRIRMTELNLSRQDLADQTGMGRERVDAICDGKEEPTCWRIMLLASVLKVDWEFFFDEDHWPDDRPKKEKPDFVQDQAEA